MTITCIIDDRHELKFESTNDTNELKISGIFPDLSATNLFQNPALARDKTGLEQVFIPFVEEARVAFGILAELEEQQNNQIVSGLRSYGQETLLGRIREINQQQLDIEMLASTAIDNCQAVFLSASPEIQRKILKAVVARVDKEFPRYFDFEKELGTYNFLQSGCNFKNLPFTLELQDLAPNVSENKTPGIFIVSALTDKPLLDVIDNTVFLSSLDKPEPKHVLTALLYGGSLGPEFLALNKGAATRLSMQDVVDHISIAKRASEKLRANKNLWNRVAYDYGKSIVDLAFSGLLATLPFIKYTAAVQFSVLDFALLGLSTFYFYIGGTELYKKFTSRHERAEREDDEIDKIDILLNQSSVSRQTRLAEVLEKFLETHGASSNRSALAPETYQFWKDSRRADIQPDFLALPHIQVSPFVPPMPMPGGLKIEIVSGSESDNDVINESSKAIINLAMKTALDIKQIESAHKAWNHLHATYLLDDFTRSLPSARGRSQRLELKPILDSMQMIPCDGDQDYPPVWKQLQKQLKSKDIDFDRNWKYVARALFAWDLIERQHTSLAVQKIAYEEIKKSLKIS